ncbi:transcription initiation factor IIF [Massariosphaeria phaeospora]|uniref:Transcription initiation factor IIF subunit beta n=1 Tax=Massariosphaeria phaeospora TaxID=100035 RepID=A0A7C8MKC8_9PLEO|nr:transcription initiation factor IIF [Massariosphaeria phaeospora]
MNGIKPDPDVKMEADGSTPSGSGYMDDEFYEDTGELALPSKGVPKDIWLTRIPDWLYQAVSKWDDLADGGSDNDEIQIGEILAFRDEARQGVSKTHPMRVFLSDRWRDKAQLPSAFELTMAPSKDDVLGNTYVFTEKDLPGYKPTGFAGYGGYGGYGFNRGGAGSSFGGTQDPKARIQKRGKYKKAIPKQTALLGSASRSYNANPLPTKEFVAFSKARTKVAIQGNNSRTNIVDNLNAHNAGESAQKMFKAFIKPASAPKSQLNKAARIPRNDLIDMLHKCFDRYKYWPMRTLKLETRQPEAYLKEILHEIAQLVNTGPFASCYMRQNMYANERKEKDQVADRPPGADDEGKDSVDEEMEDVV